MPASRRGGRPSTLALIISGALMLFLGIGLGLLLSSSGCDRKGRSRAESKRTAPEAARKSTPAPKPAQPSVPEQTRVEPRRDTPAKDGPRAQEREPKKVLPRLALVIDDLGYAPPELVTRLCAQSIPFSVAVLPFQEFSKESAEVASGRGKEVMLHLPMEPIGYPGPSKNPGPGAVMYDLSESEVRQTVRKAMDAVPHVKGVNNHMGSRITPDRRRMTWILEEIKARRCFFVDSRTEKDSVAYEVAETLKIPSVQRKVFLDDDKDFGEMSRQWERALGIARKEGQVLIIGHIYPETVEALEKLIPKSQGEVTFVKAGDLVR